MARRRAPAGPVPALVAAAALSAFVATAALAVFAAGDSGNGQVILAGPGGRITARVLTHDGIPYVSTTDLAASLSATKRWNSQSRRLEFHFSSGGKEHHFDFFVDTSTAVLDQIALNMPAPARLEEGVVFVPLPGLSEALSGPLPGGAQWDPDKMVLRLGQPESAEAAIDLTETGSRTVLRARAPASPRLEPSTGGFLILLPGLAANVDFTPPVPAGLVSSVSVESAPEGARLRVQPSPAVVGYRVDAGPEGWSLEFSADSLDVRAAGFSPLDGPVAADAVSDDDRARTFRRVVIDASHGGRDRGAAGELIEKDVALQVAEALQRVLEEEGGYEVVLTRDGDEDLSIDRRAEIVNGSGADLCIAIHADGSFASGVSGQRVLVFRGGTVSTVASRTIAGRRVEILPWSGVQARHAGASELLAASISAEVGAGQGGGAPVLRRPLRTLSSVDMPAVAVECGFVTNKADAAVLASDEKRKELAEAIARGIQAFVHRMKGEREL